MEYRAPHGALHQKGNLCSLTRREATIYQITRDGTCRGDNDALLAQYWLLMNKDGHTLVSVLIDGLRYRELEREKKIPWDDRSQSHWNDA
jgi:hypothetical protein